MTLRAVLTLGGGARFGIEGYIATFFSFGDDSRQQVNGQRKSSIQESTEWHFLGLICHTSLACALGESAPPLEKVEDQRE